MISKLFITCGIVSVFLALSSGADFAETVIDKQDVAHETD